MPASIRLCASAAGIGFRRAPARRRISVISRHQAAGRAGTEHVPDLGSSDQRRRNEERSSSAFSPMAGTKQA